MQASQVVMVLTSIVRSDEVNSIFQSCVSQQARCTDDGEQIAKNHSPTSRRAHTGQTRIRNVKHGKGSHTLRVRLDGIIADRSFVYPKYASRVPM